MEPMSVRHALNRETFAAWIKRCNTSGVPASLPLTLVPITVTHRSLPGVAIESYQWLAVGVAVRHRAGVDGHNVVARALANKLGRIAWATTAYHSQFEAGPDVFSACPRATIHLSRSAKLNS